MSNEPSGDRKAIYPALARKFHDARSEELISDFWKKDGTFRRSIAIREGAPDWVFYEGPPTANGMPGVHHVMARLCKDIMCRYKTMTGHRVLRKAGWDTHGLPVERSVEKNLGIRGAEAILAYGLEPFNAKCRESVWACKTDWDEFTERVGYWVDLDDPYITYDDKYIESVWWILSRFHAEGLLYKGHKVVPYCPVCATPLSSHEMANSYREVDDPSIFVRLRAVDAEESFLTWTTTPWTLPSNVALAVGEDFDYVRVRHGDEVLILAEARLSVLDEEGGYAILDRCKGRDLLGLSPGCLVGMEGAVAFVDFSDGKGRARTIFESEEIEKPVDFLVPLGEDAFAAVDDVVMRCLQTYPTDRYANAREVKAAFYAALQEAGDAADADLS